MSTRKLNNNQITAAKRKAFEGTHKDSQARLQAAQAEHFEAVKARRKFEKNGGKLDWTKPEHVRMATMSQPNLAFFVHPKAHVELLLADTNREDAAVKAAQARRREEMHRDRAALEKAGEPVPESLRAATEGRGRRPGPVQAAPGSYLVQRFFPNSYKETDENGGSTAVDVVLRKRTRFCDLPPAVKKTISDAYKENGLEAPKEERYTRPGQPRPQYDAMFSDVQVRVKDLPEGIVTAEYNDRTSRTENKLTKGEAQTSVADAAARAFAAENPMVKSTHNPTVQKYSTQEGDQMVAPSLAKILASEDGHFDAAAQTAAMNEAKGHVLIRRSNLRQNDSLSPQLAAMIGTYSRAVGVLTPAQEARSQKQVAEGKEPIKVPDAGGEAHVTGTGALSTQRPEHMTTIDCRWGGDAFYGQYRMSQRGSRDRSRAGGQGM